MFQVNFCTIFPAFIEHLLDFFIRKDFINNAANLSSASAERRPNCVLNVIQQLIKRNKGQFGLDMSVLA